MKVCLPSLQSAILGRVKFECCKTDIGFSVNIAIGGHLIGVKAVVIWKIFMSPFSASS